MPSRPRKENIVLIGMPGAGKSTVGVLLAKALSWSFLDTDVYLQAREGRRLQDIIDAEGLDAFCRLEERYVLSLDCRQHVIATGGSVIYSERAVRHLKSNGLAVYLDLPLDLLERRVGDLHARGVVIARGQTLAALHAERDGLYRRHADWIIDGAGKTQDQLVTEVVEGLGW